MEPVKRSPRTFIPGLVADLDSSWKKYYRRMRLGSIPLLSPRPSPYSDAFLSPSGSDSLEKQRLAPPEQGDYFSFDSRSRRGFPTSAHPSAGYANLADRATLTPTSNGSRHAFSELDQLPHLPPPTSTKRSRRFRRRCKDILPTSSWHTMLPGIHASRENDAVFPPQWIHTQVDGVDDVEKGYLPTPPSSLSSFSSSESLDKDADGDIVLPDADAPRQSPRSYRSGLRSSMSIEPKSPESAPPMPAFPAPESFQLPSRNKEDPLTPLSLSRWAPNNESTRRARFASRQLDRFILPRKSPKSSRESLRLGTPTANLSKPERTTRQRHPTFDPFSRHVPRSNRVQESFRNLRAHNPHRSSSLDLNNPLALRHGPRRISDGAVWTVGGSGVVQDSVSGIPDGRGGLFTSGTNAPLHTSMFLNEGDPISEQEAHESRLAYAMGIDPSRRVLGTFEKQASTDPAPVWMDCEWARPGSSSSRLRISREKKPVPIIPFRVLDAPSLRDDFYCTLLTYSASANCLAVALGSNVYLWSETEGVGVPEIINTSDGHVTSLSFSSQGILAIGRATGSVTLWSVFDEEPRLKSQHARPISCVSFAPNTSKRSSMRDPAMMVETEHLLVGDDLGNVSLFAVEWPARIQRDLFNWPGAMKLLARFSTHTQQICGLVWSPGCEFFATGGNDNNCFLFETKDLLSALPAVQSMEIRRTASGSHQHTVTPGSSLVPSLDANSAKHKWTLNAAVKAIAFCPWQRGLLAVGGGSNDRCIHFFHTFSGACLATIDCSAQVTGLIWSTTRREICATFGFAQPEHPFRIAVFSWPSCEQLVAIPWADEHRALCAISYPGGPNDGRTKGEGGAWWSRTQVEGCIVVATSDSSIKFHEVWSGERLKPKSRTSIFGGSEILGELHGLDNDEGMVIR